MIGFDYFKEEAMFVYGSMLLKQASADFVKDMLYIRSDIEFIEHEREERKRLYTNIQKWLNMVDEHNWDKGADQIMLKKCIVYRGDDMVSRNQILWSLKEALRDAVATGLLSEESNDN